MTARRQRMAAAVLFFFAGFQAGTWSARIPAVLQALGISRAELGVALLGSGVGVLAGIAGGTRLSCRLAARRSAVTVSAIHATALAVVGWVPNRSALVGALVLLGLSGGVITVTQNLQGVALERAHGRPVLSFLFGSLSVGALAGGAAGAAASWLGLAPRSHFTGVAAGIVLASLATTRWQISRRPDPRPERRSGRRSRQPTRVWLLAVLAFLAVLVYGTAMDWSGVYVSGDLGAGEVLGAAAPTVFVGHVCLGRLGGNAVIGWLGAAVMLRLGAGAATLGVIVVSLAANGWVALVGLALMGSGLSCILPLATSAAAAEAEHRSAAAVGLVAAVACSAYLVGPPIVGLLSGRTGLGGIFLGFAVPLAAMAITAERLLPGRPAGGKSGDSYQ